LTNKHRSTFYIGVTNNLKLRLEQHKENNDKSSFTSKYNVVFLIYYEKFTWIQEAISREKELKKWNRNKKIELIKETNPAFEFIDFGSL
jgi:putative endonuclease